MRAYFTGNTLSDASILKNFQLIADVLKSLDIVVDSEGIEFNGPNENWKSEIVKKSNISLKEKVNRKILECDFVVAEISDPSGLIAEEVAAALKFNKPVVLMYSNNAQKTSKPFIATDKNELVHVISYNDSNLEALLKDVITEVKTGNSDKFTINLSPMLKEYLNWVAENKGIQRSEFIRLLIEKELMADKDYKKLFESVEKA